MTESVVGISRNAGRLARNTHMGLPMAYDSLLLSIDYSFRDANRTAEDRAKAARKIVKSAFRPRWVIRVLREIFDASVSTEEGEEVQFKAFPEPSDRDKLLGRLRHHKVMREYRMQVPEGRKELRDFVRKYEALSIQESAIHFWNQFVEMIREARITGSDRHRGFVSDLLLGYPRIFNDVERTAALLILMANRSNELRFLVNPLDSEVVVLARLVWNALCALPVNSIPKMIVRIASASNHPLLLTELYRTPDVGDERWKDILRVWTSGKITEEMYGAIRDQSAEIQKACSDRFRFLLINSDSFVGMTEDSNSYWILGWHAGIAPDVAVAQNANLEFVRRSAIRGQKNILDGLRRYMKMPFTSPAEKERWFERMFGVEGLAKVYLLLKETS